MKKNPPTVTELARCLGHGLDMGLEVLCKRDIIEKDVRIVMTVVEGRLEHPHGLAHVMEILVLEQDNKCSIDFGTGCCCP